MSENREFTGEAHRWMARALRLAERGAETTHPNPRVGCVIVRNGNVVGEGFHARAGGPHAEIGALAEAGEAARGADVYVTLEPCCHRGRTGPCTEALIEAGVGRVHAAMEDPFPAVAGQGIARLRAAQIPSEVGLLEAQARALNVGFLSRIQRGRPWVRVKLAASIDGRTALDNGVSQWITSAAARADVQRWRARASAILTGRGTVLADDPRLNVRALYGDEPGGEADQALLRQPDRIILDPDGTALTADARMLDSGGPVHLVLAPGVELAPELAGRGVGAIHVELRDGRTDLAALLRELAAREINELHVEAGARLSGALWRAGLVDELLLYVAPTLLGPGRGLVDFSPLESMDGRINLEWQSISRVGPDLRIIARPAPQTGRRS